MLDEEEFFQVARLYLTGTGDKAERHYGPMEHEYQRITGVWPEYGADIYHHALLFNARRVARAASHCGHHVQSSAGPVWRRSYLMSQRTK